MGRLGHSTIAGLFPTKDPTYVQVEVLINSSQFFLILSCIKFLIENITIDLLYVLVSSISNRYVASLLCNIF